METEFCRERNEGKIVYEYINNTLEDIKITSPRKRHNEHRTKESVRQRKVIQTLMDRSRIKIALRKKIVSMHRLQKSRETVQPDVIWFLILFKSTMLANVIFDCSPGLATSMLKIDLNLIKFT